MKIIAITQARYGSTRLPGKVLLKVKDKTLLQLHLERAKRSSRINKLIVATTFEKDADGIVEIGESCGCTVYRGSTEDVLDRYYQAAKPENPDYVVRITSDCPLIDAEIIDIVIDKCIEGGYDYCSNTLTPTFPDGIDVEVMKFSALEKAWKDAKLISEREHVTPYIWKNSDLKGGEIFTSHNYSNSKDFSECRLTVDEESDLRLITALVNEIGDDKGWKAYADYLTGNADIFNINAHIKRNQGFMKSLLQDKIALKYATDFTNSEKHRSVIHDLIPGGAHTYSKGDDQYPQLSPAAISHGKGAHMWDIDGNEFIDCNLGLTSVSLGHAYEPVLEKVREELDRGVNFPRPSYIEKDIAEQFLELIPQHDMIKFAKNGSNVTTAAVKIARAYTGRKLIAFAADHPFYSFDDWFIGTTTCNAGVPEEISALSVRYDTSNIESLKRLFEQYPGQIACVITEPERCLPGGFGDDAKAYLEQAIELTHQNGALFIIDEMITGYKTAFPGSLTKFNLKPDMATWGKGIANGFSFCALTGTKEVMEIGGIRNRGAEKVFLMSSTHGGETHAIAAAIATLDVFKNQDVIGHNHKIGDMLIQQAGQLIQKHSLGDYIKITPCNWMVAFGFLDSKKEPSQGMRTLVMQEMIKRGVWFPGSFIPCYSHTADDIQYLITALDEVLPMYAQALLDGYEKHLVGEPAKAVFRKYL